MSPSRQEWRCPMLQFNQTDCRYWPIGIGWYWSILVHIGSYWFILTPFDCLQRLPAFTLHGSDRRWAVDPGSRDAFSVFKWQRWATVGNKWRARIVKPRNIHSMYVPSMLGFIVQASSVVSRLAFVLRGIWAEVFQSSECFISIQFHRPIWVCRQDFGIWKGIPSRFQKQERVVGLSSYGDVCSLKRF